MRHPASGLRGTTLPRARVDKVSSYATSERAYRRGYTGPCDLYVSPLLVGSEWIVARPYKVLRAMKTHAPMIALAPQLEPTRIPPTRAPTTAPMSAPTSSFKR